MIWLGAMFPAIPGNALLGLYGYLSGEKMKQDMATFGTFDSRDVAAAVSSSDAAAASRTQGDQAAT